MACKHARLGTATCTAVAVNDCRRAKKHFSLGGLGLDGRFTCENVVEGCATWRGRSLWFPVVSRPICHATGTVQD